MATNPKNTSPPSPTAAPTPAKAIRFREGQPSPQATVIALPNSQGPAPIDSSPIAWAAVSNLHDGPNSPLPSSNQPQLQQQQQLPPQLLQQQHPQLQGGNLQPQMQVPNAPSHAQINPVGNPQVGGINVPTSQSSSNPQQAQESLSSHPLQQQGYINPASAPGYNNNYTNNNPAPNFIQEQPSPRALSISQGSEIASPRRRPSASLKLGMETSHGPQSNSNPQQGFGLVVQSGHTKYSFIKSNSNSDMDDDPATSIASARRLSQTVIDSLPSTPGRVRTPTTSSSTHQRQVAPGITDEHGLGQRDGMLPPGTPRNLQESSYGVPPSLPLQMDPTSQAWEYATSATTPNFGNLPIPLGFLQNCNGF